MRDCAVNSYAEEFVPHHVQATPPTLHHRRRWHQAAVSWVVFACRAGHSLVLLQYTCLPLIVGFPASYLLLAYMFPWLVCRKRRSQASCLTTGRQFGMPSPRRTIIGTTRQMRSHGTNLARRSGWVLCACRCSKLAPVVASAFYDSLDICQSSHGEFVLCHIVCGLCHMLRI